MTRKIQTTFNENGASRIAELTQAETEALWIMEEMTTFTHEIHRARGWWTKLVKNDGVFPEEDDSAYIEEDLGCDYQIGERPAGSKSIGDIISLIHSEVSEAYEAHRTNMPDKNLPEYLGIEVELADAIIRILDAAGGLNLRVAEAMIFKLKFNKERADHSKAARLAEHGKKS